MQKEILFKGPTNALSNLYLIPGGIVVYEKEFNTSEQLYQWIKAVEHKDWVKAKAILQNKNPFTQLRLGKSIQTNNRWEKLKINVMRDVIRIKYIQCKEYREALENTGVSPIIEDTANEFWGRGKLNKGKNTLGCLHVELRSKLVL